MANTVKNKQSSDTRSLIRRLSLAHFWQGIVALLAILVSAWQQPAFAEAQLMVSPTRIVFEGSTRTAEVNLINSGTTAGTFRITFERKQMTESGAYIPVAENESGMFADPYIRFSPRQVTLEPGKSQTVRLMLRKPGDLAQGEYRSHMLFQAVPDVSTTDIEAQVQEESKGVTVRLIPILGISIPVIVRHGKLDVSSTLSNLSYRPATEKSPPALSMVIERSGTKSVYGDLIVKYRPQVNGKEYVVGMAKGVAVFTPNTRRNFTMNLQPPEGMAMREGALEVTYSQPDGEGNKFLVFSQIFINNPNK